MENVATNNKAGSTRKLPAIESLNLNLLVFVFVKIVQPEDFRLATKCEHFAQFVVRFAWLTIFIFI
jgi:hypothetical protein